MRGLKNHMLYCKFLHGVCKFRGCGLTAWQLTRLVDFQGGELICLQVYPQAPGVPLSIS